MSTPDAPRSEWFEQSPPTLSDVPEDTPAHPPAYSPAPAPAPVVTPAPATATGTGTDLGLPVVRGARIRTVVFGLFLALLAVSVPLTHYTTVRIDGSALAIGALIAAGALLLVGGLASVARERRHGR